jgi:hypothetical protein
MPAPAIDRDDPEVRARLAVHDFERRERTARIAKALGLFALAGLGPWLAGPVPGDPATVAAVLASLLFVGGGAAIWPWTWSEAEHRHHTAAAIWAQIRPTAGEDAPWTRYGAWVVADGQHVELVLVSRRGTADEAVAASPFTLTAKRRLDPDEVDDAATAMEVLRQEAADLETRAYERYRDTVSAAVRPDDAVRALDPAADDHQRRAEVQMLREVAAEDAAERRAQASAVARALRRG